MGLFCSPKKQVNVGKAVATLELYDGTKIEYGEFCGRAHAEDSITTARHYLYEAILREGKSGFLEAADGTWYNTKDVKTIHVKTEDHMEFPDD